MDKLPPGAFGNRAEEKGQTGKTEKYCSRKPTMTGEKQLETRVETMDEKRRKRPTEEMMTGERRKEEGGKRKGIARQKVKRKGEE